MGSMSTCNGISRRRPTSPTRISASRPTSASIRTVSWVSCLDPATNVQLLDEAVKAGVNVITFNSFCADRFPFVGQKDSYQDGYDLAEYLAKQIGDKGNVGILSGSLTAQDDHRGGRARCRAGRSVPPQVTRPPRASEHFGI